MRRLDRLVDYLADVRAVLTSHARAELHAVLRVDHGFDQAAWREEITRFDGHITPFREHQRV